MDKHFGLWIQRRQFESAQGYQGAEMADPVEVETQPSVKRARKMATAVASVTPLPLTIPPGQHYDLKLFFVTPSHDYAGDITILISADPPQATS